MAVKLFECENCGADGKITIKNDDLEREDIVFCPICGHDISCEESLDDE